MLGFSGLCFNNICDCSIQTTDCVAVGIGNICGADNGRYGVCNSRLQCKHLDSKCGKTLELSGEVTAKWWVSGKWLRSDLQCNSHPLYYHSEAEAETVMIYSPAFKIWLVTDGTPTTVLKQPVNHKS